MFNDQKKIDIAKRLLKKSNNKQYSFVFDMFKGEIQELISLGVNYKGVLEILKDELETDKLQYTTFLKWINKNLKNNSKSKKIEKKEKKEHKLPDRRKVMETFSQTDFTLLDKEEIEEWQKIARGEL